MRCETSRSGLTIAGVWPGPVTLARGWNRAHARRWNDELPDASLRLERGGTDFLRIASLRVREMCAADVYTPVLYPSATRVWLRAGFRPFSRLAVMERGLEVAPRKPPHDVREVEPDWDEVIEVDRHAFDQFWRLGRDGLAEAFRATTRATLLTVVIGERMAGYALVGVELGTAYLQRIAVHPGFSRSGVGRSLLRSALSWSGSAGAHVMLLNLEPDNEPARRLYASEGFESHGGQLHILRHDSD